MTNATLPTDALLIGIDIAKDKLDVARTDIDQPATFTNDEQGVTKFLATLHDVTPTLIVVEATGGYERLVVAALLDASLPVAVANPRHVRHLAKGLGILAKTDTIDARVLIAYARHAAPRLAEKRSKNQEELEALVTCRRQLLNVRTEQNNRLQQTHSLKARKAIKAVLLSIKKQIEQLDRQIEKLIHDDDDMSHTDRIIRSVPGIGPVLSATLLACCRELGTLDRREAAALVGVAPYNRDSGRFKGQRAIRGGRVAIRNVLYMAAIVAMRYNPVIKRFADRLKAEGKRTKVVIVAAMRKLITILNAMVRDDLQWHQLNLTKTT